jgi:hypothetical protein
VARKKFTALTLQNMAVGKEVADSECPGLRAKRYRSDKVSFLLRCRRPGSRRGAKIVLGWLDTHGGEASDAVMGGPVTLSQARWLNTFVGWEYETINHDDGTTTKQRTGRTVLAVAGATDHKAHDYSYAFRFEGVRIAREACQLQGLPRKLDLVHLRTSRCAC